MNPTASLNTDPIGSNDKVNNNNNAAAASGSTATAAAASASPDVCYRMEQKKDRVKDRIREKVKEKIKENNNNKTMKELAIEKFQRRETKKKSDKTKEYAKDKAKRFINELSRSLPGAVTTSTAVVLEQGQPLGQPQGQHGRQPPWKDVGQQERKGEQRLCSSDRRDLACSDFELYRRHATFRRSTTENDDQSSAHSHDGHLSDHHSDHHSDHLSDHFNDSNCPEDHEDDTSKNSTDSFEPAPVKPRSIRFQEGLQPTLSAITTSANFVSASTVATVHTATTAATATTATTVNTVNTATNPSSTSTSTTTSLFSCISIIESILRNPDIAPHLTLQQKLAIQSLRSSSYHHDAIQRQRQQHQQQQHPHTHLNRFTTSVISQRRISVQPFARSAFQPSCFRTSLVPHDVVKMIDTIEDTTDMDQQNSVQDVLAAFGGFVFDNNTTNANNNSLTKSKILVGDDDDDTDDDNDNNNDDNNDVDDDDTADVPQNDTSHQEDTSQNDTSHQNMETLSRTDQNDQATTTTTTPTQDMPPTPPTPTPPPILKKKNSSDLLLRSKRNNAAHRNLSLLSNCPPEWTQLTHEAQVQLAEYLSWENLSCWNFDILKVADLTRCTDDNDYIDDAKSSNQFCPLLLIGWSILCAPTAQQAMLTTICDRVQSESINVNAYNFQKSIHLDTEKVCNFLRQIEKLYINNPYHNNTHAADVTQTVHCLIQMGGQTMQQIYPPIDLFSILLAAVFHDVGHPGTNNMFQINAMTSPALRYNEVSVLENMHSAIGHEMLLGERKQEEWDIFHNWEKEQVLRCRKLMIGAILGTDMTHHFSSLDNLRSAIEEMMEENNESSPLLEEPSLNDDPNVLSTLSTQIHSDVVDDNEYHELAQDILKFILHAADISNPAKPNPLAVQWADFMLKESFAQGSRENQLHLPISPLCDSTTVKKPESQIGFIQFVIRPTYEVLGKIIPRVKEEICPLVETNLDFWTRTKSSRSMLTCMPEMMEDDLEESSDTEEEEE